MEKSVPACLSQSRGYCQQVSRKGVSFSLEPTPARNRGPALGAHTHVPPLFPDAMVLIINNVARAKKKRREPRNTGFTGFYE